jgi:hypothetical protein
MTRTTTKDDITLGAHRGMAWPIEALLAAIRRAETCAPDQHEPAADEIRRALVQARRLCRDVTHAAEQALERLARRGAAT